MGSQLTMRHWDGWTKVATIWDSSTNDPDVFDNDGDCLVYLSESSLYEEKHSFAVPLDRLIAAKCLPLFEKLTAVDYSSPVNSRSRDRWKKASYTICLAASDLLEVEEVQMYDVTTRNFFAWLMSKPIVGPDPASALLALKFRMDLWRAPTVDSLSDLHKYAKSQGYGDLGDISLFLTNHLRGKMIKTDEYRLVDGTAERLVINHSNGTLRASIKRRLASIQFRFLPLRYNKDDSTRVETVRPTLDSNETFMSGAVAADMETGTPLKSLFHKATDSICESDASFREGVGTMKKQIGRILIDRHYQPSRTYSLPTLPNGSMHNASSELEKRSSWIESLARDHIEQYKKGPKSPLPTRGRGVVSSIQDISSPPALQPSSRPSIHQGRTSLQLSRPPSPIKEDIVDHVPPVPEKNPRRYSLDGISLGKDWTPAMSIPSWLPKPAFGEAPSVLTSSENRNPASASACISAKTPCKNPSLPSQVIVNCKTCGKPKPPDSVRHHLVRRPPTAPSREKVGLSFESEIIRDKSARRRLPDHMSSETIPSSLRDSRLAPTRFPNLRSSKSSTLSINPGNKNATPPVPVANNAANSLQHLDISGPNLRSSLAQTDTQKRKRVTIEIPRSNDILALTELSGKPVVTLRPSSINSASSINRSSLSSEQFHQVKKDDGSDAGPKILKSITSDPPRNTRGLSGSILKSSDVLKIHDSPVDDEMLCSSAISVMDELLDNIAVSSYDLDTTNLPCSEATYRSPTPTVEEISPVKLHVSIVPPTYSERESLTAKATARNRLRNSLRAWSYKEKTAESVSQVYQGNILVMDASGKFTTIASPVSKTEVDWTEG